MNKVILMGRLTRDPEVRYTTTNNTLVATFPIAVNRRFARQGEERQADFINIVAWDKTGEFCSKYFKNGMQVAVTGRIQTRNYDDKDGKKVYVTEILATNISFLDAKGTGNGGNNLYGMPEPPMQEEVQPERVETVSVEKDPFEAFGDSIEISDNDLPF